MSKKRRKQGQKRVQAAAAKPKAETEKPALATVINPDAMTRWVSSGKNQYTPERIESILTSAAGGSLLGQWELFDMMEGTWPELMKSLNELKRPAQRIDLPVQAWTSKEDEPTPEAQRRADVVSAALWGMRPDPCADENEFADTFYDVLDAWAKGMSVLEVDWERRQSDFGQVIAPKSTRWVHPRYYGYPHDGGRLMLDTSNEEVQLRDSLHDSMHGQYAEFPPNKFIISVCKHKTGAAASGALLRPLAFWWAAANFTSEWFLNFAQIFGMPIRWATHSQDASKSTIDLICDMLANMGSSAWAAFPEGTQLELKEASKSGGDNPQAYLLNFADRLCHRLILRQTLTSDVGDSGSRALGEVHGDVRGDLIEEVCQFGAKVINYQLIPAICRLNFGDDNLCPWVMPNVETPKDAKAMAERDKILKEMGVEMPKAWFYERHEVPLPAEGEEVIGGQAGDIKDEPTETDEDEPTPEDEPTETEEEDNTEDKPTEARSVKAKASPAQKKLAANIGESITAARGQWLAPVAPFLESLIELAESESLSDAEFLADLEAAVDGLPVLNDQPVAAALERALGASVINGAELALNTKEAGA